MSSPEKFLSIKTAAQQLHFDPQAWRSAAAELFSPARRGWLIIPLVFLINLILVAPLLMPLYTEVNPDDEAKYIQSGQLLLQGELRDLAWGPLVALVVLALALGRRRDAKIKILAASVIPTAAVLAIFVLLSLILQGTPNLGLSGKSWDSFEMNQPVPEGSGLEPRQETQRLFGTAEENQGSVLRAVWRNPMAFTGRLLTNVIAVPSSYLDFFNKTQGPLLLFCAAWGVYFLIKRRQAALLIILFLWPLHTAINLVFFTRHIIPQAYYLPVILGAVGIWGLSDPEINPTERLVAGLAVLFYFLVSWWGGKPAFLPGALLLAAGLGIAWLVKPALSTERERRLLPLLLLLAAGLMLRAPYPFPNFPPLGKTENEQAIRYLEEQFQPQTLILSDTARPAIASRLNNLVIDNIPAGID